MGAGIDCGTTAESCRVGDVFSWPLPRWEEKRWWQSLKQSIGDLGISGAQEVKEHLTRRGCVQRSGVKQLNGRRKMVPSFFFLETCYLQEWGSADGAGNVSFWYQGPLFPHNQLVFTQRDWSSLTWLLLFYVLSWLMHKLIVLDGCSFLLYICKIFVFWIKFFFVLLHSKI